MSEHTNDQGRFGAWMETISGRRFWPADPRAADVHIEDIAHALSRQCRFGGHVHAFYSVAQHCELVSRHVPPEDALSGLLHDSAEAYVVDLPSPLKWNLRRLAQDRGDTSDYDYMEAQVFAAISERFRLPTPVPKSVKIADTRALLTERRDLRSATAHLWEADKGHAPFSEHITAWEPDEAKAQFLFRFAQISKERERTALGGDRS